MDFYKEGKNTLTHQQSQRGRYLKKNGERGKKKKEKTFKCFNISLYIFVSIWFCSNILSWSERTHCKIRLGFKGGNVQMELNSEYEFQKHI